MGIEPYNDEGHLERLADTMRRLGILTLPGPTQPRRTPSGTPSPINVSSYSTDLPESGCAQCRGVGFVDLRTEREGHSGLIHGLIASETVPCERCTLQDDTYQRLRRLAGLPQTEDREPWSFAQYRTVNDDAERSRDAVAAWVDDARHPTLFLFGSIGTGKTMLACAATEALMRRGIPARFWAVPALMAALGDAIGQDQRARATGEIPPAGSYYHELRDELLSTGVLVLDDLGTERDTDFVAERLYEIVNGRYADRSRLIVTTNTPAAEMDRRILDRVRDRDRSVMVRMEWESFRTARREPD